MAKKLPPLPADVRVSDHAILRLIERKYNIDVEELRREILQPTVVAALRMGAKGIVHEGLEYVLANKTVITIIKPDYKKNR